MKISPEAWAIYRAACQEEGPVQPTDYERLLIALGFSPSRLSDITAGLRYIHYTTPSMHTTALYLPTEAAIEDIVYFVQNPPKDYDPKRMEVCKSILEDSGVTPDQYSQYLMRRRQRLR